MPHVILSDAEIAAEAAAARARRDERAAAAKVESRARRTLARAGWDAGESDLLEAAREEFEGRGADRDGCAEIVSAAIRLRDVEGARVRRIDPGEVDVSPPQREPRRSAGASAADRPFGWIPPETGKTPPRREAKAGAGGEQDRGATPEAVHHEEEKMPEIAAVPPERRHMLQMNQLTAEDRDRVRKLIRHMHDQRGGKEIPLADARDEVARATDTGDGRGGLHIHGNAFRVLVQEALGTANAEASASEPGADGAVAAAGDGLGQVETAAAPASDEVEKLSQPPLAPGQLRIPPGPGDPTFAPCGCSLMKIAAGLCDQYEKDGTVRPPASPGPERAEPRPPPSANGNGKHADAPVAAPKAAVPPVATGETFLTSPRGALRGGPQPDGTFRLAITVRGVCAAEYHALVSTGLATVLGLTPEQGGHRVA